MKSNISRGERETRKKFNILKRYYDKTWDSKDHTLHVGIFKKNTKNLKESYYNATDYLIKKINKASKINKESVILDVGCGAGRTLITICEKYGCSGIGVDISDEMVKDAKKYLEKLNKKRNEEKLQKINIKFIRGSGSKLNKLLKKDKQFTHIISQDALLLVVDKYSLYDNLHRLLKKRGILGIADFLGEGKKEELENKQRVLIYKMINWAESLSFNNYKKILCSVGFKLISSEKKDKDMIKTYEFLAKEMNKHLKSKDQIFKSLQDRYESIVGAVKTKKMGWGIFIAQKNRSFTRKLRNVSKGT